jgi:hypothetical protein
MFCVVGSELKSALIESLVGEQGFLLGANTSLSHPVLQIMTAQKAALRIRALNPNSMSL